MVTCNSKACRYQRFHVECALTTRESASTPHWHCPHCIVKPKVEMWMKHTSELASDGTRCIFCEKPASGQVGLSHASILSFLRFGATVLTVPRSTYSQMIRCDSSSCPHETFHLPCVGLKEFPKVKSADEKQEEEWLCPPCETQAKHSEWRRNLRNMHVLRFCYCQKPVQGPVRLSSFSHWTSSVGR